MHYSLSVPVIFRQTKALQVSAKNLMIICGSNIAFLYIYNIVFYHVNHLIDLTFSDCMFPTGHVSSLQSGFEGTTKSPSNIALAFYDAMWAYDGW